MSAARTPIEDDDLVVTIGASCRRAGHQAEVAWEQKAMKKMKVSLSPTTARALAQAIRDAHRKAAQHEDDAGVDEEEDEGDEDEGVDEDDDEGDEDEGSDEEDEDSDEDDEEDEEDEEDGTRSRGRSFDRSTAPPRLDLTALWPTSTTSS